MHSPADPTTLDAVASRRAVLTRVAATAGLVVAGSGVDLLSPAAAARRPERHGRGKHHHRDREPGKGGHGKHPRKSKKAGKRARSTAYRKKTVVLATADRHLVGRFSYGVTPALAKQVEKAGGARAWFERQLEPASIPDGYADGLKAWWPGLANGPQLLWANTQSGVEPGWEVMQDLQRWVLMRRIHSQRQVLEVMTEFWENHLHVPVNGDGSFTYRVDYGELVRRHALGSFVDLLTDAVTHPALGIFLDNAVSTRRAPNENLGRELLELHTVGRGNYDESDVKDSARILTGWRVDTYKTWSATYVPTDHATGPVSVMGFSDANASSDGRDLTRRYLRYLALHPATAQRICRKLAVKLVRDEPPQTLVDQLAAVYLANDGRVVPVLRALVGSSAFAGSVGAKVRDPGEDVVATYRVLGIRPSRPTRDEDAANAILWQVGSLGALPFGWARPDGAPIDNASWATTSRMLAAFDVHYSLSGQWWPSTGATFTSHSRWLPQRQIRFDRLVDHLSRQLLQRPASPTMLTACREAVGVGRKTVITRKHDLVKWGMPRLLTTLLDSPTHMSR
ncbi:DUF1800 domain-containing protein [Nocardioides sp. LHG3406-4]|uniref:DUF1800 domain-containing protein n=1 Tax=Nocardioides sp. LHG3406-4 TaxID=2804575 RepID=UPI003CF3B9E3